jgi:hypothetical protein
MIFKQQRIGVFLLKATSLCAAILFIIFSSYLGTNSIELSKEKKAGFSSSARLADDLLLSNSPVTVPLPAVFAKKGNSVRTSFTSKFIHLIPQMLFVGQSVFSLAGKAVLVSQPLRLHLALRVLRI